MLENSIFTLNLRINVNWKTSKEWKDQVKEIEFGVIVWNVLCYQFKENGKAKHEPISKYLKQVGKNR